jgi:hypothetical protein
VLKHGYHVGRYHVGRYLAGEAVLVESIDGLLNVIHNGTVVATHAKRHLEDDEPKFEGRPKAVRPSKPTLDTGVILGGRATSVPFTAVMTGPQRTTTDNAEAASTCAALRFCR